MVASLAWGTRPVVTRAAFDEGFDAYTVSALRAPISAVVITLVVLALRRGIPRSKEVWLLGSFVGITVFALPSLLFAVALHYASAGFVGVLVALVPLATAVVAHLSPLDERIGPIKVGGLVVGIAGIGFMLLSGDDGLATQGWPALAVLLTVVASVSVGIGWVSLKLKGGHFQATQLAVPQFVAGSVVLLAVVAVRGGGFGSPTAAGWGLLVYLSIVAQLLPFLAILWVIQHTSSTHSMMSAYITPLLSIGLGILILDERLEPGIVVGGLLIILSVVITDRLESRARFVPPDPATVALE